MGRQGYIAVCPDLFWRQEPGLDLSHWTDAEWKKGLAFYNAYNIETGVSDIVDTITTARTLDGSSGRVGVMGFCLGGLMTFLTAARGNVDGAVAYYPGSAEKHLAEVNAVSIPILMHLGEEDEFISADAQRMIKDAFASNTAAQIYSYPGCSHAFARHTGVHYDPKATEIANERTWAFFDRKLR
jgi:carboxymethylenebutenolidase